MERDVLEMPVYREPHQKGAPMSTIYDALIGLSPSRDAELIEGYRRYAGQLAALLTPDQVETYAAYIRRTGTLPIFEDLDAEELVALTPEENVIATSIIADEQAAMENRRVVALLLQHSAPGAPAMPAPGG